MRTQACSSCGSFFEVKERFVGGIVNCPACGRAAEVAGLRDHRWKGLVAVVAVGWLFASVLPRLPWWTIPASAMVVVLGSWLEFFLGLHRLLAVTGCLLGWAIMKAAYA